MKKSAVIMNTDEAQRWFTNGYKKDRNDSPPALANESRRAAATLILTEVEQQLEVDETEYNSVKDMFDYIKMVYLSGAGRGRRIPARTIDWTPADRAEYRISAEAGSRGSCGDRIHFSLENDEKVAREKPRGLQRGYERRDTAAGHPADERHRDNTLDPRAKKPRSRQCPRYNARSYKFSPRLQDIYRDGRVEADHENRSDSGDENADFTDDNIIGSGAGAGKRTSVRGEELSEYAVEINFAEYSKGIGEEIDGDCSAGSKEAASPAPEQEREICFNDSPRRLRRSPRKPEELYINVWGSEESVGTIKTKKLISKKRRKVITGTSEKNVVEHRSLDDTLRATSKLVTRKKRRRMKSSNSKSTTATARDIRIPLENNKDNGRRKVNEREEKEEKKKVETRNVAAVTGDRGTTPTSSQCNEHGRDVAANIIQENRSRVVEIYHNSAPLAKSHESLCAISGEDSRVPEARGRSRDAAVTTYEKGSEPKGLVPHCRRFADGNDESDNRVPRRCFEYSGKSGERIAEYRDDETGARMEIRNEASRDTVATADLRLNNIFHRSDAIISTLENAKRSGGEQPSRNNYGSPRKLVDEAAECPIIRSDRDATPSEKLNDYRAELRCRCSRCSRGSGDTPRAIRNYELPTVASRMKRVDGSSYSNGFNFRNIPFVVGTSLAPSYNLGLNIQQTLSLIKTRRAIPGGVTPLLISKVGKVVLRRVSNAFPGCNENCRRRCRHCRTRHRRNEESSTFHFDAASAEICNNNPERMATTDDGTATNHAQVARFSLPTPRFIETLPSTRKRKTSWPSICSSMKLNSRRNAQDNLQLTQSCALPRHEKQRRVLDIGDSQSINGRSVSHRNTNGIREVLVNFHDQFEAMNSKYEKLQEQAEKTNDESLKNEIATLEKELATKEEEINAVVNLYKEVLALKQRMKLLHERKSLVCVATESPGSTVYPQMSFRARTANPMFEIRGPSESDDKRGPSTSTRLAALLRQIKIFQKQLKSAS